MNKIRRKFLQNFLKSLLLMNIFIPFLNFNNKLNLKYKKIKKEKQNNLIWYLDPKDK